MNDFWWRFFGGVGRGPRNNRLDFGANPDHDPHPEFPNPDPGIFKMALYLLLPLLYRQSRIKRDNPWRRYVLCRLLFSIPRYSGDAQP